MAWTRHGHHIPGTIYDNAERPSMVPRCLGFTRCSSCNDDVRNYSMHIFEAGEFKTSFSSSEEGTDFPLRARRAVTIYVNRRRLSSDSESTKPITEGETYVVWFSKTLQNWKALVSTTEPDGMYYEVTYNGDKREIYLDAYQKADNVVLRLDPSP